jgi:hypothetical protein
MFIFHIPLRSLSAPMSVFVSVFLLRRTFSANISAHALKQKTSFVGHILLQGFLSSRKNGGLQTMRLDFWGSQDRPIHCLIHLQITWPRVKLMLSTMSQHPGVTVTPLVNQSLAF